MPDKALPNWVKVDKKRFNGIKNQTPNAKNNNLQARPNRGSPISLNELHKLIQDIEHSQITLEEALKIMTNIRNGIERINNLAEINQN